MQLEAMIIILALTASPIFSYPIIARQVNKIYHDSDSEAGGSWDSLHDSLQSPLSKLKSDYSQLSRMRTPNVATGKPLKPEVVNSYPSPQKPQLVEHSEAEVHGVMPTRNGRETPKVMNISQYKKKKSSESLEQEVQTDTPTMSPSGTSSLAETQSLKGKHSSGDLGSQDSRNDDYPPSSSESFKSAFSRLDDEAPGPKQNHDSPHSSRESFKSAHSRLEHKPSVQTHSGSQAQDPRKNDTPQSSRKDLNSLRLQESNSSPRLRTPKVEADAPLEPTPPQKNRPWYTVKNGAGKIAKGAVNGYEKTKEEVKALVANAKERFPGKKTKGEEPVKDAKGTVSSEQGSQGKGWPKTLFGKKKNDKTLSDADGLSNSKQGKSWLKTPFGRKKNDKASKDADGPSSFEQGTQGSATDSVVKETKSEGTANGAKATSSSKYSKTFMKNMREKAKKAGDFVTGANAKIFKGKDKKQQGKSELPAESSDKE
ncbi:hypothetical protein AMATHDRAFT_9799 [Amanita thiersii Skay4041]|uniref:Uncharacterized protein n=1 Tax=Amanita thiersii Skay4041 TaxID=703135 RepID=A0A2A9NBW6_9AGAR|nr:hypothetical protein AMATHDRAFT_9799 [Amanita thiersii Skay4041]